MFQRLHHVAYRCKDAQRTVDFYTKVIGLEYSAGLMPPEGHTHWYYGDPADSIHIFFKLGDGTYLAFFEIAGYEDEKQDPSTPLWVKHIAFEVPSMEFLVEAQKRLTAAGVDSRGPKDHGICHSVYFEDPDGHRLEITCRADKLGMWDKLAEEAPKNLAEWNERKKRWGNRQIHKPKLTVAAE
jgi:catechol 2,3-dioxygenase-like lactoylglutathione lyase family enzyme